MTQPSNPLLSTKSSDTGLEVVLHPLVLLNISDHITRHVARQQQGPIVGALLGQQIGRTISLEHVFECYLIKTDEGIILHRTWFDDRLRQCTCALNRDYLGGELIITCSQGCP